MEPAGAETRTILERISTQIDDVHARLSTQINDVHALVVTVKEAAELQSVRVDGLDQRMTGLTGRVNGIEPRMEQGFSRVDERFEALTAEMRSGFDDLRRERRRRPKRGD